MRAHFAWCCGLVLIQATAERRVVAAEDLPQRYPLEYPAAEFFCPPIPGYFDEIQRTISRAGYRTFRHQPNGGYGLPIRSRVGDAHLLHLGADVGWHRVGEPVFAVANGVVRISEGPAADEERKRPQAGALAWGNLIVLEHRLSADRYATTIYGHLANDRLVKAGELVRAGQQIGRIGTTRVNGGYKPHLHFGVREGRMAELGRKLAPLFIGEKQFVLKIAELREEVLVLSEAEDLSERLQLSINGRKFEIRRRGDKAEVAASFLVHVPSPDFPIIGYGLSTEGWLDPTEFLQTHRAHFNPAAYEVARKTSSRARTAERADNRRARPETNDE